MKEIRNVRIIAVNDGNKDGFFIYVELSGQREFLLKHRHNYYLYKILENGISLEELQRVKSHELLTRRGIRLYGNTSSMVENTVHHLKLVVKDYMQEIMEDVKYAYIFFLIVGGLHRKGFLKALLPYTHKIQNRNI